MQVFCHKGWLICLNIFPFNSSIVIENLKDCFLETIHFFNQTYRFLYSPENHYYQNFIIAVSYYLRPKFLKSYFEFCYCQQMKIRKTSLKALLCFKKLDFKY